MLKIRDSSLLNRKTDQCTFKKHLSYMIDRGCQYDYPTQPHELPLKFHVPKAK